jgi:hypothetical protein
LDKKFVTLLLGMVCLLIQSAYADVTLTCHFNISSNQRDPIYNFWSIRNEIPPYPRPNTQQRGRRRLPQANSMNCIRLLGGWAKNGKMQPEEDSCYWDDARQTYSYRLSKVTDRIDGVIGQGYQIHQLVLDNPPWCFQRGLSFGNNKGAGQYPEKDRVSTYGNSLPPGDPEAWRDFIKAVMNKLVEKYGMKQVQNWRFRLGTESDYHPHHWAGSKIDYFNHYRNTANAVLSVVPDATLAAHFLGAGGNGRYGAEFVTWCHQNKLKFDFIGISFYPTYNKPRQMDLDRVYKDDYLPFTSARGWPRSARLEIPEHSLYTEPAPNIGIGVETSHARAYEIMMAGWVYEHSIGQVHSWGDKTDLISYLALGTMVGKNRFNGQTSGTLNKPSNKVDGIFAADDDRNSIDAIVYNFSADPEYVADETVNLSFTVPARVGTRYAYRILTCDRQNNAHWQFVKKHPEAGKRVNEGGWVTNRVKPDSDQPTDKNGNFDRILEEPGKSLWKKQKEGLERASLPKWSQTNFTTTGRGRARNSSTLDLTLQLSSFSFQKVEFRKVSSRGR